MKCPKCNSLYLHARVDLEQWEYTEEDQDIAITISKSTRIECECGHTDQAEGFGLNRTLEFGRS